MIFSLSAGSLAVYKACQTGMNRQRPIRIAEI